MARTIALLATLLLLPRAEAKPPNIIILMMDDLGFTAMHLEWDRKMPRPETARTLIGNRFIIRYRSGLTVEVSYPDANQLIWKSKGASGTEKASITEVAPGVYMVSWIEKGGLTVTNALNLNTNTAHSVVTFAGSGGRESTFDSGTIERAP